LRRGSGGVRNDAARPQPRQVSVHEFRAVSPSLRSGFGWNEIERRCYFAITRLAAAAMFSALKPNFFCSSFNGAEAPKDFIVTASPLKPR
jgi:hypothetical protein